MRLIALLFVFMALSVGSASPASANPCTVTSGHRCPPCGTFHGHIFPC